MFKYFTLFLLIIGITSIFLFIFSSLEYMGLAKSDFSFIEAISLLFLYVIVLNVTLRFIVKKLWHKKVFAQIPASFFMFLLSSVGVILTLIVVTFLWIRYEVKTACYDARHEYSGDCVNALSQVVSDEGQPFIRRNEAVWALGQLADKRALPVLNKYYTGQIPRKESLYKTISQYELKKAIGWCRKGSIMSFMY